ncbi:hypothetical protein Gotri_003130 [Gossypium trilobum]|uniref:Uncharacterized protein n=1 Tax=Gossypium trilobum TaxID=34281 RepID=A0A7J9FCI4_9ROSI|nr:hypothetical protein [Gossypium trilobum]
MISSHYMKMGHMAPELMVSRDFEAVSCKSDVYSHGALKLGHHLNDPEMPLKPVFISVQYLRETKSELDSPKEMLLPETMERSS